MKNNSHKNQDNLTFNSNNHSPEIKLSKEPLFIIKCKLTKTLSIIQYNYQ
jgi:hypothetical protein